MSDDWRADLADAVARGLVENGWDAVVDALGELGDELAVHPDAPVEPLVPSVPILAVTTCEAGHLGVLVNVDGRVSVHLGRTPDALVAQVSETAEPGLVETAEHYPGPATTDERREVLEQAGLTVPAWFSGSGFTETELLDACGAVVVAVGRAGTING
ncbi:MAG: hypothetical protein EON52_22555 [Actinomycetales bacterium]|nr:MAG: hypothetical protein EON52_22555 [Actinomycetales bacterium]